MHHPPPGLLRAFFTNSHTVEPACTLLYVLLGVVYMYIMSVYASSVLTYIVFLHKWMRSNILLWTFAVAPLNSSISAKFYAPRNLDVPEFYVYLGLIVVIRW